MKLGIVGKPNVGKSTFFQCVTDSEAEMGDYPFTTIEPNLGVGYVVIDCPCTRLDVTCDANTRCVDGKRYVPVNMLDIAGLVPGAAKGKGMGNEFLDAVREADALIHIVDVSGTTDEKGEPTEDYDPARDVSFVEDEFDAWLFSIIHDRWDELLKEMRSSDAAPEEVLADKLSGLKVSRDDINRTLHADTDELQQWDEDDIRAFVDELRQRAKPMLTACNKADHPAAQDNLAALEDGFTDDTFVPMSARAELQLQKAAEQGVIDYVPGDDDFTITGDVSGEQEQGLEQIRDLLQRHGGTGVQEAMHAAVFDLLDMIVVYPVEDTASYEDQHGNVLPDAILLPAGSTPVDLAYQIHSDIGDRYSKAKDAETGRAIGKDTALERGQIVKIETQ